MLGRLRKAPPGAVCVSPAPPSAAISPVIPALPTGAGAVRRRPMNSTTIATRQAPTQIPAVVAAAELSASWAAAAPLAYVQSHNPGTSGLTAAAHVPSLLS